MTQTTADLLINSIRDPHDPRLCGSCLIGCLEKIFPSSQRRAGASKRRDNILNTHRDVWNALILFLTTKRTHKQMQRLLTRLSLCNCRITEAHIHELHIVGDECRPRILARSIFKMDSKDLSSLSPTVIGSCLPIDIFTLLTETLPDTGVRTVAKGSTSWPTSPTELLPLGADVFVTAMLQWQDVLEDFIVFALCGSALRLCRDLLLRSMVSHSFCGHLVNAGRTLFDQYMEYLIAEDHSSAGLRAADVFALQLHAIHIFLKVLVSLEIDQKVSLLRGHETKLCQLCALLLHVTTDPRYPTIKSVMQGFPIIASCGQELYRLFHMHLPPRPLIPLHPQIINIDNRCFPPAASVRSPPQAPIIAILCNKAGTRCSGLNCSNSFQSVGRSFQRCGRCNIVAYCGRECQTQEWRNETFPHRIVCPILQDLVAKGGGWQTFSRPWHIVTPIVLGKWVASGVSNADLQYVHDWSKDREKRLSLPDGTEWTPGFDDYDSIIWQFGASGKGPKPCYPNRLARWPSEVAKVTALLEVLPFWEQDIV